MDILEDGSLDQELDLLAELDVVVASVHSKLRMESPAMTERMLAAVESPHTDILGHCTGRLITGRGPPQSTFDAAAVFAACARTARRWRSTRGPSARTHRRTSSATPSRSGAPSPSTPTPTRRASSAGSAVAARNAVAAGVPFERIVNRGSVDELLAWAAAHARRRA